MGVRANFGVSNASGAARPRTVGLATSALALSLALLPGFGCSGDDPGETNDTESQTSSTTEEETTETPGTTTTDPSTTDPTTTTSETTTTDPSTSSSTGVPGGCGDGIKADEEECDGEDLGAIINCEDLDIGSQSEGGPVVGCNDDCTLDISQCNICYAPAVNEPCDDDNYNRMHALELGCDEFDGFDDSNATALIESNFQSPDPDAWRVLKRVGTHDVDNMPAWHSRAGDKFVMLTTGNLPFADQGVLEVSPGAAQWGEQTNDNPDGYAELPGVMSHTYGGVDPMDENQLTPFMNCDGTNDCSDTLKDLWELGNVKGQDVVYLEFRVNVPEGTHGFALDFAYFSAEFPEWVGQLQFNDLVVIWATSESYTGNIAYIDDGNGQKLPLVTTYLDERGMFVFDQQAPELDETGFDAVGGGTGWLKARGTAQPGEELTVAVSVIDRGDTLLDTAILLDNFQWECAACIPGSVDEAGSCGVALN